MREVELAACLDVIGLTSPGARAGGSVLLASANNNVAATTLAGSAGGDFEYQDVDALAIGNVSALGMNEKNSAQHQRMHAPQRQAGAGDGQRGGAVAQARRKKGT